nr:MAG TPA: hypothetical protein [Bacteriophage sp.]
MKHAILSNFYSSIFHAKNPHFLNLYNTVCPEVVY